MTLRLVRAYDPSPGDDIERAAAEVVRRRSIDDDDDCWLLFNGEALFVSSKATASEIVAEYRDRLRKK